MLKKLTDVPAGKVVVIREFASDDIHIKLMEMGCVPGEEICIDKIAPLGDPISVEVSGYMLSLRREEAANILVEENNSHDDRFVLWLV